MDAELEKILAAYVEDKEGMAALREQIARIEKRVTALEDEKENTDARRIIDLTRQLEDIHKEAKDRIKDRNRILFTAFVGVVCTMLGSAVMLYLTHLKK